MVNRNENCRWGNRSGINILLSLILMLSVLLIGFSGTAVAAGPSISSVDVPDPSLVGTETAEVHVSGTVDIH